MELPPRLQYGWTITKDVYTETQHDNVVIIAAGVAFYSVLAVIPVLFIALSIYGLFTEVEEAERQIEALLEVFPDISSVALDQQMRSVADASHAHLSFGFVAAIAGLLWTVSNATRALIRAVKIAYDQETERSRLENRFVAIGLTLGIIVGLVIALALIAAVPIWIGSLDPTHAIVSFGNLRYLLLVLAMAFGSGLLYRFAPPRRPDGWRAVVPGAIFATVMWTLASVGFSVYVGSFSSYNETYGALGAAVVLLLWFWLSALAIVIGAEINEAIALHPYAASEYEDEAPVPSDTRTGG